MLQAGKGARGKAEGLAPPQHTETRSANSAPEGKLVNSAACWYFFRTVEGRIQGAAPATSQCPRASGRTSLMSTSRNWSDFINTAKCPASLRGTNSFLGALIEAR